MEKKITIILIITSIFFVSFAEETENNEFGKEINTEEDDLFRIEYTKKSAAKAMLLSALFPGAGNFYANPKSITTYIFPLIEIGLWYGYIHYNKMGDDKTKDYEYYANKEVVGYYDGNPDNNNPANLIYRYNRDDQYQTEHYLIEVNPDDSYDENLFILDDHDSQEFYEDIGKHNIYLFGWNDWYNIYAVHPDGYFTNPAWIFDANTWNGVEPANENASNYLEYQTAYDSHTGKYSVYREKYVKMREDAEKLYGNAVSCSFGIVFNHILASLDALRLTRKRNVQYTNNLKIKVAPVFVNNKLSPSIMLTKRF